MAQPRQLTRLLLHDSLSEVSCNDKSPDNPLSNGHSRASRDKAAADAPAAATNCSPPSSSSLTSGGSATPCGVEGGLCESSVVLPVALGWAADRFASNFDYDPLARCIYWREQFYEYEQDKNYIMRYCFDRPSVRVAFASVFQCTIVATISSNAMQYIYMSSELQTRLYYCLSFDDSSYSYADTIKYENTTCNLIGE